MVTKLKNNKDEEDKYFINLLDKMGDAGTCNRGKCAAIITRGGVIISTGYVSSPYGLPTCKEVGDQMEERNQYIDDIFDKPFENPQLEKDGLIYRWNNNSGRYETNKKAHCIRTVHAEANAICSAAKLGTPVGGCTIYVSMTPCRNCAMLIIQCGINRVVCEKKYHAGVESEYMFKKAGIELVIINDEVVKYSNQTIN